MFRALIIALFTSGPLYADVLVAARTLRAGTPLSAGDLVLSSDPAPLGAATHPDDAIGMEARVTLYAGRPIPLASLSPPALVERNQLVTLSFSHHGLEIRADGRALGRAAEGEAVRIMNLASRSTVTGTVIAPGLVRVP